LETTIWFVTEGYDDSLERDVERLEMYSAWCVNKDILPRQMIMPSMPIDPVEVKTTKGGEKRAQARLELPLCDIWIPFSEAKSDKKVEVFREMIMSSASQIECGKLNYETFLIG
jgi:hypothetical protein